jgi:hypothetical protein
MRTCEADSVLIAGPVAPRPGDVLCCEKEKILHFAQVHAMRMQTAKDGVLQLARVDAAAGDAKTGNSVRCSEKKEMMHLCQSHFEQGHAWMCEYAQEWVQQTDDVQVLKTAPADPDLGAGGNQVMRHAVQRHSDQNAVRHRDCANPGQMWQN